jgi:hypothetical protein
MTSTPGAASSSLSYGKHREIKIEAELPLPHWGWPNVCPVMIAQGRVNMKKHIPPCPEMRLSTGRTVGKGGRGTRIPG